MRIAHIIKVTNVAGAETHLLTLLAGLKTRGLLPQVLMLVEAGKPMDDYEAALNERGIPAHKFRIHSDFDPTLPPRLRRALRMIKPHIVHTHLFHADLYGTLAAKWARVPVIVTSRHNDNAFRRREPYRSLNRGLWHMTDAGIAISNSIAKFTIAVESAPPPKIQTIPYGLDYKRLSPDEREQRRREVRQELGVDDARLLVGMACRLVAQKGVSDGLNAFVQVVEQVPTAQLVIAGDGPLRADLEAEAAALGLAENVRFLGWCEDVPRLMSAFDLLLMPSLWEGFGLVILEAMSQRLPVVATEVSAIPEIVVPGETGLLVPSRDVNALAEAMMTLLADRSLRRHMGLLGEDRLETHFSAQRMVNETVALYQKLI